MAINKYYLNALNQQQNSHLPINLHYNCKLVFTKYGTIHVCVIYTLSTLNTLNTFEFCDMLLQNTVTSLNTTIRPSSAGLCMLKDVHHIENNPFISCTTEDNLSYNT